MKFNSSNLLVTGGAGFIGSNFISYLLDKYENINIVNLDLLTYAGSMKNMKSFYSNSNYKFIEGDICDQKIVVDIFKKYNIDGVINFAAESHVDNSIENPNIFIKSNINGVFNLLNIAYSFWMLKPFKAKEKYKQARFHQISTDEVYGSIEEGSFNEQSKYAPNSPYSASKASADMLVRSFNKTFGLNTTISISSNNFGSNQNNEKFIPKVIHSLINNISIPIYGDGLNIRDWIFVEDHCKAIDLVYNHGEEGEVYNVAGKNEFTNLELVDMIYNILKKQYKISKKIEYVSDRYGHDRRYSICIDKIINNLNWVPATDFKIKLEKYIMKIHNEK